MRTRFEAFYYVYDVKRYIFFRLVKFYRTAPTVRTVPRTTRLYIYINTPLNQLIPKAMINTLKWKLTGSYEHIAHNMNACVWFACDVCCSLHASFNDEQHHKFQSQLFAILSTCGGGRRRRAVHVLLKLLVNWGIRRTF